MFDITLKCLNSVLECSDVSALNDESFVGEYRVAREDELEIKEKHSNTH